MQWAMIQIWRSDLMQIDEQVITWLCGHLFLSDVRSLSISLQWLASNKKDIIEQTCGERVNIVRAAIATELHISETLHFC